MKMVGSERIALKYIDEWLRDQVVAVENQVQIHCLKMVSLMFKYKLQIKKI